MVNGGAAIIKIERDRLRRDLRSRAAKGELELVDGDANKLGLLTDNGLGRTKS